MLKSNTSDVYSHMKTKINLDHDSPFEKTLNTQNVGISLFISLFIKKNNNHYYCNAFLEKCSYK